MITKLHAQKDSRHKFAWFALLACVSYSGTEPALSAEIPAAAPEASAPPINGTPEIVNVIPADNPIGAILLGKHHPLLLRADFSRVSEFVSQIYQSTQFQPLWFTANRSEKNLNDLLSVLNNAPNDALKPANYDVERLKQFIATPTLDSNTTASYDVALTVSLVRYLHDLRQGQVDPRDVQYPVHIAPKPPIDLAGLLKQHLSSQTLSELVGQFEPKAKQYQQLKQILNRLQQLGNQSGTAEFKPGKVLHPGDKHPQIAYLRQRLRAMGMIEGDNDSKTYDNDLVAAVKKVQQQQGLKADGVIGSTTAALFNQSSREKVAQIELAMERARWIPDPTEGPMIVVNIPAFELWAFNSVDDPKPLNMKVIVGKAPDKQTPVLWEEMKYLEFMPYWNIPSTIFKKEILPKAANNQGYLASQDIELVKHQNSEEQGGGSYLRARQRPGKKNPLGRVKFVFPNTADVYLHDTPGHAAFNRPRRDLSHGCVRVSEPEQLAQFVLGDQQGWDKETIKQAMSAPKTRHVSLKRAVPVLFYYATTFVDHENQLRFYPDVYGQDEQLKKALDKIQAPNMVNASQNNQLAATKITAMLANP
ncbi:L,D-transpeptidase family protein [Methylomonas sp. 2BW1-5-20]|uniref:L,D-transpeptidase family protein n=1 Tax=Methylomonas sp. 2BW1-5-20 TaxID=3376686 RepID=UPI004050AE41